MDELLTLSARELAGKIASGEVKALDATHAYLTHLHAHDKTVRAFITTIDQTAWGQAKAIDEKIRAASRSAL